MITFDDFSIRLALGQLKNTAAVDEDNMGVICPKYYSTILSLTNQGLLDLSTRLPIIKRTVDLTFQTGKLVYAMTDVGVGDYLDDSLAEAFVEEDYVKALDIFDEDGKVYSLNTNGHIMTPTFNTIRFTAAKIEEISAVGEQTGKIRIRYQAKHAGIAADGSIDLPPNLETGLQLFVASLYLSHMNGKEHSDKGDSYFAAYLRHIGEDEVRNTSSTSEVNEDTRFEDRGFC